MDRIDALKVNIQTQDNRATGNPYFIVTERGNESVQNYHMAVFFTMVTAEEYIELNAHHLADPWIWIKSGNNNPEWPAVRHYFGGGD